jgi:hypothetical protein
VSRTVITHPDGTQTSVVTRSGCGQGCSWVFWLVVGLFVIAFPAESGWPLVGIVGAYALVALVAVAGIRQYLVRHGGPKAH